MIVVVSMPSLGGLDLDGNSFNLARLLGTQDCTVLVAETNQLLAGNVLTVRRVSSFCVRPPAGNRPKHVGLYEVRSGTG